MKDENIIPEITHPLGKHWDQPSKDNILIDDKNALMSEKDFNELKEYSCSVPSGAYEGKMWKNYDGTNWGLVWYGESENPDNASINYRKIII